MSEYTVDNLNIQISATATQGINDMSNLIETVDTLNIKLAATSDMLGLIKSSLSSFSGSSNGLSSSFNSAKESASELDNKLRETITSTKELSKLASGIKYPTSTGGGSYFPHAEADKFKLTMDSIFDLGKVVMYSRGLVGMFREATIGAMDFIENYNLFHVTMGQASDEAMRFQSIMNGKLGANMSETIRYQGFFKGLSSSLGIANEGAMILSENLTKLTYDLSSLFNIDVDEMYGKLSSGMVGQTKPLRSVGIDVTQQTLQGYLDAMGYQDIMVQQLTQSEKVLLRYIAILDQSSLAHGDMARSIEAPANQLKVMSQQWAELTYWVGNAFVSAVGTALQWINGLLIALKSVAKAIATFFGFKLSDYEYVDKGFGSSMADEYDQVGAAVGGVGKAAADTSAKIKEMNGLFGFDKINAVQTPKATNTPKGGGGGGVNGVGSPKIYDDLLKNLKGYDNQMSKIKMKANGIAQDILKWLGFTSDLNKITGELTNIKWRGLDQMATSAKVILGILGSIMAFKIGSKVVALGSSVFGLFSGVDRWVRKLLGYSVGTKLNLLFKMVKAGVSSLGVTKGLTAATKAWWGMLSPITQVALGLGTFAAGTALASNGAKHLAREGELTAGTMAKFGVGLGGAAAGGAMLGSVIPGVGTVIGAIVGVTAGGIIAFANYNKEMAKIRYEAALFDGIGVPIRDFTKNVIASIEAVNSVGNEVAKYSKIQDESREIIKAASGEINTLNVKLSSNFYRSNAEDIQLMSDSLDEMKRAVKDNGDAYVTAMILSNNKLVEQKVLSKEVADRLVEDAIRKQEAENNFMAAYSIKMNDLTRQVNDGTISQQEYADSVNALNQEYADIIDNSVTFEDSLNALISITEQKINLGNWNDLNNSITDITDAYKKQEEVSRANYQSELENTEKYIRKSNEKLANLKSNGKETSDVYKTEEQNLKDLIEKKTATTKSFALDNDSMKRSTADALATILTQMYSTGNELTSEGKKTSKMIEEELNGLGYKVDFKTGLITSAENGEQAIFRKFSDVGNFAGKDMTDSFILETGEIMKYSKDMNPKVDVYSDTSAAYTGVNQLQKDINGRYSRIKVGVYSDGQSISYKGGGGSLRMYPQFADGGFPEGENGLFYANSNELVGKFTNGKTAVANNNQIVEGIRRGVADANKDVVRAILSKKGNQPIILNIDSREVARATAREMIDAIDNETISTGKTFKTV